MPWQMAPPLIIIAGAFTATGLLLRGTDYLVYGKHRRIQMDEYNFKLDNRDALIKDSIKKAELAAKEHEEKLRAAAESEGSHT